MQLKKLEIYGFKSFAQRVEMCFTQGITGVVGPNGSGKSNISDAIRWVLGEQSAKTLRGGKMEDVIFGGTEKRRRLAWAEVILTFDNTDRALPIDYGEVAVMRRIYRNGESEYMINSAPCRLRDIVDMFRDTGIGKEGYSLIGQGRIDEILSVKSEERRQVFEEAAGIVKYKARKSEAERRLENTAANLQRVEDLIEELKGRLDPLRSQSAAAREYLQLRDELKALDLNLFVHRFDEYQQRITALKDSVSSVNESIEQCEQEQAAQTAEREKTQHRLTALEAQSAQVREAVQTLIREVEESEGALKVLNERIGAAQREHSRLSALLEQAASDAEAIARRIEDTRSRAFDESGASEAARERLRTLEAALESLSAQLAEREQSAEALKSEMIRAINRLSDVKSEQSRLRAMEDALTTRLDALLSEDETSGALELRLQEDMQRAEADLQQARQEKLLLDAQLSETQSALSTTTQQVDELSNRHRALLSQLQESSSRLKVLEEMRRDYEGYQHSVKKVLQYAKKQKDTGMHGVVASLIHVPREIERAVDMVLGNALQNIVVEREEDAQRMIDYLRANHLGRATFLPLTSVHGRTLTAQERPILQTEGCVGLAGELISFDKKYQGIVDSLLGRTVIARDLTCGIRIQRAAHHAFRVVTLEGDVMHSGGSMTGGSVQSRMTSLLSREREISEHKEQIHSLTTSLSSLDTDLSIAEERRAALKQRRAALFDAVHQQEIACAREEAHLTSAREALQAQHDRISRTRSERERMHAQLEDVRTALSQIQEHQQGEEQNEANHQAQIVLLNGEITALRAELTDRQRIVTDERIRQAARERGLTALQSDLNRLTNEQANLARQREDTQRSLEKAQRLLSGDHAAIDEQTALLNAQRGNLRHMRDAFEQVDRTRTEAQQRLQKISHRLDELQSALNDFVERQHRTQLQLSRMDVELKQLTDRIWQDYELTYAGARKYLSADFCPEDAEKRISFIRQQIRAMGSVNVGAVDEYRQTLERFEALSAQRDDLTRAQLDIAGIIEDLTKKMESQFRSRFAELNQNFQQTFVSLFGGGHAELILADPKDVLNCSIDVIAQPPGKKLQMLSLLSGGERALTAIAILFAMLRLKPTPFCFLDEIEAALDDANIDSFADYLRSFSKDTQFVVITHRKGTMERCDALYGVAMEEKGVSTMVSVKLSEALDL